LEVSVARLLSILALSVILVGAGAPNGDYSFDLRGRSLVAVGGGEALRQAVVEYTSAILENPHDAGALKVRALLYAETGRYRAAIHDADTASRYGIDEMYYYYLVGRSRPSIEYLRRAFRLACIKGDRTMISTVGMLLLDYETKYPYITEERVLP
jgi:hypothetical protein